MTTTLNESKILKVLKDFDVKCSICDFNEWLVDKKIRVLVDASMNSKDVKPVISVTCSLCSHIELFDRN